MAIYVPDYDSPYTEEGPPGAASPGAQTTAAPDDWFAVNAPAAGPTDAGPAMPPVAQGQPLAQPDRRPNFQPPAPFDPYTALQRPDHLSGPYQPMQWQGGDFAPPSMQEVMNAPGYQTRFQTGQQALERSAAARGTILSGGTQKATARYGQEFGANEYGAEFGRRYQTYLGKYGQFRDAAAADSQARMTNETQFENDQSANRNQFQERYTSYLDNLSGTRQAELDYWNQDNTEQDRRLRAIEAGRPV